MSKPDYTDPRSYIYKESRKNSSKKPTKWRRLLQIGLVIIVIICGYILFLQFSPQTKVLSSHEQDLYVARVIKKPELNTLIIPKISVASPIYSGDYKVLEKGTWHRFPERGNPKDGGNFILAAHRYVFAWIPQRVNEQSILYNIDKLNVGDSIYVDWQGQRYQYQVSEKHQVSPNETSIEDRSKTPKLTLYSCTLNGERDGRVVIIAKPI